MTAKFCVLALALLLAACGGDTGMRCRISAGNLDAIKAQVLTMRGWRHDLGAALSSTLMSPMSFMA